MDLKSETLTSRFLSHRRAVAWLLLLHAVLVGMCAVRYSFSWTEGWLLAAGLIDFGYAAMISGDAQAAALGLLTC